MIITVPCIETSRVGNKEVHKTRHLNILPDQLDIEGEIIPEYRYRGIYKVLVYNTRLKFSGWFDSASLPNSEYRDCNIIWDKAVITAGINDPQGINKKIMIIWNGKEIMTSPGSSHQLYKILYPTRACSGDDSGRVIAAFPMKKASCGDHQYEAQKDEPVKCLR